jgi:hypothetical protein
MSYRPHYRYCEACRVDLGLSNGSEGATDEPCDICGVLACCHFKHDSALTGVERTAIRIAMANRARDGGTPKTQWDRLDDPMGEGPTQWDLTDDFD